MRPNRYIIIFSILLGVFGIWFSADAVAQYLSATRAMAAVEVRYVQDSFVWLDSDYERARAEYLIVNDSNNEVTVQYFSQQLYFDGIFAGGYYDGWEVVTIPAGEGLSIEIPYFISMTEMRPTAADAELTVRGEIRLGFEGFEREMTLPIANVIGYVPFEGDH